MDVREYRKQYEAELAASAPAQSSFRSAFSTAEHAIASFVGLETPAPVKAPSTEPGLIDDVPKLIESLRNVQAPATDRRASLHALQAARFQGERFAPYRADFLAALRAIVHPDSDPQLRLDAIEELASEKDFGIQDLLRRGLQDPQSALVPPAKALQFLSLDDHADAADLALETFHNSDDLTTKEAALRVLAIAPKSQDLFEELIKDKSQPRTLRALSATGLNLLNPQRFSAMARDLIFDGSDFDDIRATSIGALTNAPDQTTLRADAPLVDQIKRLEDRSGAGVLQSAASLFLAKP
ncbi:hypothetical protein [Beijerinckia sp. L45]|uniref:hypothetical protein n=1 Tax=Beijerinckia sp. L45 TaxID=1641855 RepID=UPI00131AC389|nr:hypothetical protein [Beijerinckia sp. L45]